MNYYQIREKIEEKFTGIKVSHWYLKDWLNDKILGYLLNKDYFKKLH